MSKSYIEIKVPQAGESVQEAMIGAWLKEDGDFVEQDEPIVELETDKASMEVVAESAGVLSTLAEVGAVVNVGDVIAKLKSQAAPQKKSPTTSKNDSNESHKKHGPAVARLQKEHLVDLEKLEPGSGKDGRVTKGDVLHHLNSNQTPKTQTPKTTTEEKATKPPATLAVTDPTPASLASHILETTHSKKRESSKTPMSMIRRRIADRLLSATQQTAMLTTFNEVDMSAVLELRSMYKESFQKTHGIKLGFMGFFIKASVHALDKFPKINSYIQDTDIITHNYSDIGVAVSTDHGLVVPVIQDAQNKSIHEIEVLVAHYAEKARNKKLALADMQGGTFTITNGGVFGSLLSTPILNPPQSAILGMHKTELRPIVTKAGNIEARPMMYLALSYDHRIVDGKEAVQFLVTIKETLEDPRRILLGI